MNAQSQQPNQLVEKTRAAGLALRSGDMSQLKALAQTIGKAGGSVSPASAADLGSKPAQLTQLTRQAGNQAGGKQREITHDKPPPGQGR